jgi:hypothetical protein
MINYLNKRQISNILPDKTLIVNFLKGRFNESKNFQFLNELIKYKNIKLNLIILDSSYKKLLVCPLQIKENFFLAEFEKDIFLKYTNLYLKIIDNKRRVVYQTDLVKVSQTSFIFYPFDYEIYELENGKLEWFPNKIKIYEKILNLEIAEKYNLKHSFIFYSLIFSIIFLVIICLKYY